MNDPVELLRVIRAMSFVTVVILVVLVVTDALVFAWVRRALRDVMQMLELVRGYVQVARGEKTLTAANLAEVRQRSADLQEVAVRVQETAAKAVDVAEKIASSPPPVSDSGQLSVVRASGIPHG